jgi:hypothetical protein
VSGFAFGAATAAVWGGAWGCCYDDIDIDRTVNINRNDAYNRWNQSQVRSNLESRAQSLTPEQRQQVQQRAQSRAQGVTPEQRQRAQQAAQSRGATRANDVYAGRDGNTYRRGAQGWEQNSGQGWNRANFSPGGESAAGLNSEQRARSTGAARETSSQGGGRGGGISAGGGGGRPAGGGARAGGGGRGGGGGRRR